MADTQQPNVLDKNFFLQADDFFSAHKDCGLTYDDLSLCTLYSDILPRETQLETRLAEGIELHLPILSSDMDTVTESRMAIAMAQHGGMGLIHYNMTARDQLKEVSRVKNHVHGLITDPITVRPESLIGEVLELIERKGFTFSTFPVVDASEKLIGLLPGNVVRPRNANRSVSEALLPRNEVMTLAEKDLGNDPIAVADRVFAEHPRIDKLMVVDAQDHLRGLFTLSDVDRITHERQEQFKPARDREFRLLCGAAVSASRTSSGDLDREKTLHHVEALVERGVDAIAVSTAHGHTRGVGETVRMIRDAFEHLPIIAGNVTTGGGVSYLTECGANCIKIGQGPGSICTTRVVAGVGVPQMTALYIASRAAKQLGVTILADGGITKSGDIVKALTLADAVICGNLLAGCEEAPGEILEISGKLYKQYRGMGSLAAMKAGSAARYGHSIKDRTRKISAEGVEALKEVSGPVDKVLAQLIGGIQSGMGYLGAADLPGLRSKARYARVTPAGQREAAPHDIVELKTGRQ